MRCLVRHRFAFISLAAALLGVQAFAASAAFAQTPAGRITGVVRDAAGAPRPGARVTAMNTATGATRSATTAADGAYAIGGLAPGAYTVSASVAGMRRSAPASVRVAGDGAAASADFVLEPLRLQAVTVTATLREQQLADVPFSIAAPSARELRERGVENMEGIAANVAGFSVQNLGPGQSQVALRGASAGQVARDQPGVKEQVGAYLDNSPISMSLFTPDLDLFDISRVEVLRGPQGTLFGSGSLAGTVRYITNQPELGARSTFGEVGGSWIGGGDGGANVKLGANAPLGDRAAGRVAAYYNRLGGYMDAVQPNLGVDKNVNTGMRGGVRAALRIEPSNKLSITPRIVYQRVKMDGWNRIDAYNILANPFTTTRPAVKLGKRELFTQIREPFTDDFVLGDLNARYDFGRVNLTSITSYTWRDILVVRDAGALTASITGGSLGLPANVYTLNSPLDDATKGKVFTEELRLAGGNQRARWLIGGFLARNKRDYGQSLLVAGFQDSAAADGADIPTQGLRAKRDELFFSDLSYDLTQRAVFGEATVSLLDRLELTGGLRYYSFDEDRAQVFDGIFANDNTGTTLVSTPGSTSANGLAPRFIARFKAAEGITFNAQAAQGFRLGGINDPLNVPLCTPQDLATFGGRASWKDEKTWNYEVGAKTLWAGGRASLNLSAFYMDIRDLQLIVTAGSCSSRLVFNVPKSMSRGAELELTMAPSQYFDFAVSGTLNNAELRSTLTSTDTAGVVSVVSGIEKGNRLPSVPRVQAAAAATVRRPVWSGGLGFLTATYNHVGSRYTQIDDLAAGFGTVDLNSFAESGGATIGGPLTQSTFRFDPKLPAYDLVNLRLGITRAKWETALFVNNLTDERALLALDRERGTRARVGYLTNQPRTAGISMSFTY
ncbi:MAG: TonB-dependent receptor [Gemmatimonadaceae bacterium]